MSHATEIGYGGAAGGGKSHLGRISAIYFSYCIPGMQTYLFRRQHNELVKNHMEGMTGFPALLHPWVKSGFVRIVKDEIRFANGSKIFLCHCQHEKDVYNWLGPEMYYLIIEQAEQFTPFMIQMLRSRNRMPDDLKIPEAFKGLFPRCLYTFNPGNIGHAFFKSKFVKALNRGPDGVSEVVQMPDDEGGKKRQFIQAKLDDNPSVDPVQYRKTLMGLPTKMVKAYLDGDFEQVMGAFFPEIDPKQHLIKPFQVPSHWVRLMGMDWGSCGEADPFAIGWWAVASEPFRAENLMGNHFNIPRNSLICYRRWYGRGLPKQTATMVAEGIKRREKKDESISLRVAGGDIDAKKGWGKTLLETFAEEDIHFMHADRRRQPGHAEYRERLVGKNDVPMIYYFSPFADSLETIQNLQHDLIDPNECTDNDDHNYEADRYVCMARPFTEPKPAKAKSLHELFKEPTLNELWEMKEKLKNSRTR